MPCLVPQHSKIGNKVRGGLGGRVQTVFVVIESLVELVLLPRSLGLVSSFAVVFNNGPAYLSDLLDCIDIGGLIPTNVSGFNLDYLGLGLHGKGPVFMQVTDLVKAVF